LGESASFKVYIVKIRPPVFAVGDDKKKGKGRKGKERYTKSQVGYISADFHKYLHGCRGPRRNHSLQFWFQYFQGFQIYRGSKCPCSHWLCWSSLQQCWRYRAACDAK